jgi:hypothetical protein
MFSYRFEATYSSSEIDLKVTNSCSAIDFESINSYSSRDLKTTDSCLS